MQYLITFARACFSVGKKEQQTGKIFLYRNLKCSIFVTGLLKILLFWWNSMINTSVAALKQVLSFPL